jgi:hypothetical protein
MVIVFGTAAIVLPVVQARRMPFRQAALVILAGVLPLAAAGWVARMMRLVPQGRCVDARADLLQARRRGRCTRPRSS